jgi:hypothetical protein
MALGIAVDATIHYFARFNADSRRQASESQAAVSALSGVIQPVSYTTLGLCLGFGALTIGEFRDHVEFGLLAAFTLAVSWVVVLTLTPALCAGLKVVTLWDIATLRLGAEPHWSVPILRGLSARQARKLVRICELERLSVDERLFAGHDRRDSAYIVLEGELIVFTTRDLMPIVIDKLRAGDAVGAWGEHDLDHDPTVEAVTDVRLLRVSRPALQSLRTRHPKIAEIVDGNLEQQVRESSSETSGGHSQ